MRWSSPQSIILSALLMRRRQAAGARCDPWRNGGVVKGYSDMVREGFSAALDQVKPKRTEGGAKLLPSHAFVLGHGFSGLTHETAVGIALPARGPRRRGMRAHRRGSRQAAVPRQGMPTTEADLGCRSVAGQADPRVGVVFANLGRRGCSLGANLTQCLPRARVLLRHDVCVMKRTIRSTGIVS